MHLHMFANTHCFLVLSIVYSHAFNKILFPVQHACVCIHALFIVYMFSSVKKCQSSIPELRIYSNNLWRFSIEYITVSVHKLDVYLIAIPG